MKVIITGNGRSGSSFVTNLVNVITGYNCGETRPGDKNNKWGYWENVNINESSHWGRCNCNGGTC